MRKQEDNGMNLEDKFPREIKLEDSWFEWEYNKFKQLLETYHAERRKLEYMQHETTKPIPCKSWTKCYFFGDEPENLAQLWTEINDYIKEQSTKKGWTYSHIDTEEVDVNTDPYDDFENLTDQYIVYAVVENKEDFRESEEYVSQESLIQDLYYEVMDLKKRIDSKLKGK